MRLLYITVTMPFGVGEEFFIPEVRELLNRGHQLLIVPRSPAAETTNGDARGLQDISIRRSLASPAVLLAAATEVVCHPWRTFRALAMLVTPLRPRIMLKNLIVLPKALWLARLARSWQAEHIHAQWASTTATMAMVASEVTGIPWSLSAHRGDVVENNLLAEKTTSARFTRYISESGVRLAQYYDALQDPAKLVVIHMGVRVPTLVDAPRPSGRMTILCPADYYPVKGHRFLLHAMAELKRGGMSLSLRLAGQGQLQKELQCLAAELGLSGGVEFLGRVPHDRILHWYLTGEIDLVVLPSVDLGNGLHEGIPVSLMEAMAHGIPVISTNTGGIPELLHDGAGLLVPPQDPGALAEAMERLIVTPALRKQYAEAGRRRIVEEFSLECSVAQLLDRIERTTFTAHSRLGSMSMSSDQL